jgi:hypothetical protein
MTIVLLVTFAMFASAARVRKRQVPLDQQFGVIGYRERIPDHSEHKPRNLTI